MSEDQIINIEQPTTLENKELEENNNKNLEENEIKLSPIPEFSKKGVPIDEYGLWLSKIMDQDNLLHELYERIYGFNNIHSFGHLKRVNFNSSSIHLDRHRVLELIYSHLHSIGLHYVSDVLKDESKLIFQRKDQLMDRTDLRLLISMSLGPRDNIWDNTDIENINVFEELFDEDNGSIKFFESPNNTIKNYFEENKDNIIYSNNEEYFNNIKEITLSNLIIKIIQNNNNYITLNDRNKFFCTLNTICESSHFFLHLIQLYNNEKVLNNDQNNILNLIEEWINFLGLFIGKRTLNNINFFINNLLKNNNNNTEKLNLILNKLNNLNYGNHNIIKIDPPLPIIVDPVKLLHPNLTLADASPEEVARQITLITYKLFSVIHPREFYFSISNRNISKNTPNIHELLEFGRRLKYLIASTIVSGKTFELCLEKMSVMISIAKCLLEINNFESLSWFVSAFQMKSIINLSQITNNLSKELQDILNYLLNNFNYKNLSKEYENLLFECYNNQKPSIPNIRYELSNVSNKDFYGDDFINNRINWIKRDQIGIYILKYITMQNNEFNFYGILQIQNVLRKGTNLSKDQINNLSNEIELPNLENNIDLIEINQNSKEEIIEEDDDEEEINTLN